MGKIEKIDKSNGWMWVNTDFFIVEGSVNGYYYILGKVGYIFYILKMNIFYDLGILEFWYFSRLIFVYVFEECV